MPRHEGGNAGKLSFGLPRPSSGIWIGCSLGALFFGVISVTLKPILSKPWADFCVGLGIALLVFAAVSITLWLIVGGAAKSGQPNAAGADTPDPNDSSPRASAAKNKPREDSESTDSREERSFAEAQGFVLCIFGILLWLGVVGLALYASGLASPLPFWRQFGRLAGTGLLLALGFFAIGMLFGFLFGLPRSPRRPEKSQTDTNPKSGNSDDSARSPAPSKKDDDRTAYGDNTNLEEVSDWLTKIIVGLGLINLKDAPGQLKRLSDFFAYTCGSEFCGAIFLTLGAFFFVIGFVSSYILARVYVKLAFALTDALLAPGVEKVAQQAAKQTVKETVKQSTETPWGSLKAMTLVRMASDTNNLKEASESQLDLAIRFIDEALASKPGPDIEYIALIEKGRALKRKAQLVTGTDHNRLLQDALHELESARPLAADRGAPLYNAACYKALLDPPLMTEALADLKESFRLSPDLKKRAKGDDDLKALRDQPEFKAMVGDGT